VVYYDLGRMLVKGFLVLAAVVTAFLVASSTALANSTTCAHGQTCSPGSPGSASAPLRGGGGGTLPFTGLNLAAIAGVAGLFLVTGVTLQRASRRRR
jgi:phosphotransferase system  glucose/maltose/N-acetylglucosamine-specific IIC component